MPNTQSAIKELRKSRAHAAHNVRIKKNIKALYKKALALSRAENADDARKAYVMFQQAGDKAAKIGVLHRNAVNRKKSTLMKLVAHASKPTLQ